MGIDPMTHQPRIDIFASMPQLPALANLEHLLETSPHLFHDQDLGLQAEAGQLAKLQNLQQLLVQSQNGIAVADMEALNLNQVIPSSSHFSFGDATSQQLHHPTLLPHLLDRQVPFSFQTSLNNEKTPVSGDQMGNFSSFTMLIQRDNQTENSSSWLLPAPDFPPAATETSLIDPGDASSSSGNNGAASPYWPQLYFDDTIMHEIS